MRLAIVLIVENNTPHVRGMADLACFVDVYRGSCLNNSHKVRRIQSHTRDVFSCVMFSGVFVMYFAWLSSEHWLLGGLRLVFLLAWSGRGGWEKNVERNAKMRIVCARVFAIARCEHWNLLRKIELLENCRWFCCLWNAIVDVEMKRVGKRCWL